MVPPWRSSTARLMARPTPLDPPANPDRNGWRISSASSGRTPGPRSATEISTPRSVLARRHGHLGAVGAVANRVVDQVRQHLADLGRVHVDDGQPGLDVEADRHRRGSARNRSAASRTSSARSIGSRWGTIAPDSMRLSSMRFATRRSSRPASRSIRRRRRSWVAGSCSTPPSNSVAAPRMVASGVRRSCETDRSSSERCRSTSASASMRVETTAVTTTATMPNTTSATTSSATSTWIDPSGGSEKANPTARGHGGDVARHAPTQHGCAHHGQHQEQGDDDAGQVVLERQRDRHDRNDGDDGTDGDPTRGEALQEQVVEPSARLDVVHPTSSAHSATGAPHRGVRS